MASEELIAEAASRKASWSSEVWARYQVLPMHQQPDIYLAHMLASQLTTARAEAESLRERVETAESVLKEVSWNGHLRLLVCPSCGMKRKDGHASDCRLSAVLARSLAPSPAPPVADWVEKVREALQRIAGSNIHDMNTLHPTSCPPIAAEALALLPAAAAKPEGERT